MRPAKVALLADRGVVRVAGEDAEKLLQGIISNDMELLSAKSAGQLHPAIHAALLSPQGKILFDFFVVRDGESSYLLDVARSQSADLVKRLNLYKLRAKAEFKEISSDAVVTVVWGGEVPALPDDFLEVVDKQDSDYFIFSPREFEDPRCQQLGRRWLLPSDLAEAMLASTPRLARVAEPEYDAHRIALGVPEIGKDYPPGDTFPHDANLDRLNSVSFTKGCFVGQEVVSRMQHRTDARKRIVHIEAAEEISQGIEIKAGQVVIGTVGYTVGKHGLALVRLDRAKEALDKGEKLTADSVAITIRVPSYLAPMAAAEAP